MENVTGTGIGEEGGKPVIKVYVIKKTKSLEEKVYNIIKDYPVSIEVTGKICAF
ncbi:MAG: hypothetical protein AB1630_04550 [bacterium]